MINMKQVDLKTLKIEEVKAIGFDLIHQKGLIENQLLQIMQELEFRAKNPVSSETSNS